MNTCASSVAVEVLGLDGAAEPRALLLPFLVRKLQMCFDILVETDKAITTTAASSSSGTITVCVCVCVCSCPKL